MLFAVASIAVTPATASTPTPSTPAASTPSSARHLTDETIGALRRGLESSGRQFQWKTIPQGAATSVLGGDSAELDSARRPYLEDCGVAEVTRRPGVEHRRAGLRPGPSARADALWDLSERLVAR